MEKIKSFFSGDRVLILIVLLAIVIRLPGIGAAPFFDEVTWAYYINEFLTFSANSSNFIPHPPLAIILYSLFVTIFGFSVISLRLFPLFIGILTLVVTYYFAKSLYGRKVAVLSAFLLSFIFYHVWMSLFIDVDGNLLTLFSLITLYSFHRFEKTTKKKWVFFAGISLGIALLSKYPAGLLIPILFLYDLIYNKLRNLKPVLLIAIIGIAVFSFFPLFSFAMDSPNIFFDTLKWGAEGAGRMDSSNILSSYLLSVSRLVIFMFQYGTPILCLIPMYLFLFRKHQRMDYILLFYIAFMLVFFTFVTTGGPKVRYIMPVVPALAILASRTINVIFKRFEKNEVIIFFAFFLVSVLLIVLFNSYGVQEAFNSRNLQFNLLLQNSVFWYSGFASTPFAIHVHSLIFIITISIMLFLLSLKFGRKLIIIILSISIAFNFFVLAQSFYPSYGPNFSDTMHEMVDYEIDKVDCDKYATEKSFEFYMDGAEFLDYTSRYSVKGCIYSVDVQGFVSSQGFGEYVRDCETLKVFNSNGFDFGFIHYCD